jgi:hypothetical protein
MDPFRLCLALGPAAVYLLLLGAVNLARRPLLVSGTRDTAALGLALAGFIVVGPIELFFPHQAALRFGPFVWILVLGLYGLCLVLALLLMRPRLVVYNITPDELRPLLADAVELLDDEARWAGDSLAMPSLGVQLHVESFRPMRHVSLVSIGANQSHAGWHRLELVLRGALSRIEVGPNPRGVSLMMAGTLTMTGLALVIYNNPETMTRQLTEVFDVVRRMLLVR